MQPESLNIDQERILNIPLNRSIFLEGEAGTGKTTFAIARLEQLLSNFPGHQILVLVPQRSLGKPYIELHQPAITVFWFFTFNMDSRRPYASNGRFILACHLQRSRFFKSNSPSSIPFNRNCPILHGKGDNSIFGTGFFPILVLSRNRLYGQILDDLNKSAIIRFPLMRSPNG